MERLNREVRRCTRVVGAFPDGQSALMLVAARLRHVAGTRWGTRRYLDMSRPREPAMTELATAAACAVPLLRLRPMGSASAAGMNLPREMLFGKVRKLTHATRH